MISVTINAETPDALLSDLQRVFPSLLAGTPLPPMQEQPKENREPLPPENVKEIELPKERKSRAKKEAGEASAGEQTTLTSAPAAETNSSGKSEPEASTDQAAQASADGAASGADTPDIELVRAKLKQLGATDGLGHDKVFEVLGKCKATNASSVPPEKRAELIAEIDALLAGVSK